MAFNNENIALVRGEFTTKYLRARERSEKKMHEIHGKIPEIREIDTEFNKIGIGIISLTLNKSAEETIRHKIDQMKAKSESLSAKRAEILQKNGYPTNYTDVVYDCSLCSDTGFTNDKMCTCMKRELILKGYESSGLGSLLKKQDFDSFSLDYYDGQHKSTMSDILNICKDYAENFCLSSQNLLLFGGTGLGKTHMTTSIAKIVINKGFDTLYVCAQDLYNVFDNERFNRFNNTDKRESERYFNCDLFIIDDLGTETANAFFVPCIYNIINTRYNKSLPTIINTNLTKNEISQKYTDRIASRLLGEYCLMPFVGEDIRKKKLQN